MKSRTTFNSRWSLPLIASGLLLIGLTWFALRVDVTDLGVLRRLERKVGLGKPPETDEITLNVNSSDPVATLRSYKLYYAYPPDSRPLHRANWDLLHPWKVDTQPLPMLPADLMRQVSKLRAAHASESEIQKRFSDNPNLGKGPRFVFDSNKSIITGTEDEYVASLSILDKDQKKLKYSVTMAEMTGDSLFDSLRLGGVEYSCNNEEQNFSCVFKWKNPAKEKKYWGQLTLTFTASVQGLSDELQGQQTFYSSPMMAGRFTGHFNEELNDGSLVVHTGIEVFSHSLCSVSANLYSLDENIPTHHAERRMIVDPSMSEIDFTFFGKIFRDNGYEGRFKVADLKGQCENFPFPPEWALDTSGAHAQAITDAGQKPPEPTQIYFEYNTLSHVTENYSLASFSSQEYDSSEKRAKLDMYQRIAQELADSPHNDLKNTMIRSP